MPFKSVKHSFKVMGGPAELQIYLNGQDEAYVVKLAKDEAFRLEKKYSRYRTDSITTAINRSAGTPQGFHADEETTGLLNYANIAWQQSEGLFDITSGILRKAWDFKSNTLPTQKCINKLLVHVGWDKVTWQPPILYLPKEMEIDFGGVVKEYAADAIASIIRNQGIHHGLVDLAGDIAIVGPQPDEKPWKIGVRDPSHPNTAAATIDVLNGGIASSGNYERFMIIDGKRYCHIINPKTGWPQHGVGGVSVHASTCLVAGTATTTAMLLGEIQGDEWLRSSQFEYILLKD